MVTSTSLPIWDKSSAHRSEIVFCFSFLHCFKTLTLFLHYRYTWRAWICSKKCLKFCVTWPPTVQHRFTLVDTPRYTQPLHNDSIVYVLDRVTMVVFTGRGVLQGKQVTVWLHGSGWRSSEHNQHQTLNHMVWRTDQKDLCHCQVSHKELILKSQLQIIRFMLWAIL